MISDRIVINNTKLKKLFGLQHEKLCNVKLRKEEKKMYFPLSQVKKFDKSIDAK